MVIFKSKQKKFKECLKKKTSKSSKNCIPLKVLNFWV